ncbi:unnamed protein product [Caenorhabditis sp. 36 PRJEB53466]|nr:unnamed protein product [Caenorhabditis sp. 36 PRJEB53466]
MLPSPGLSFEPLWRVGRFWVQKLEVKTTQTVVDPKDQPKDPKDQKEEYMDEDSGLGDDANAEVRHLRNLLDLIMNPDEGIDDPLHEASLIEMYIQRHNFVLRELLQQRARAMAERERLVELRRVLEAEQAGPEELEEPEDGEPAPKRQKLESDDPGEKEMDEK